MLFVFFVLLVLNRYANKLGRRLLVPALTILTLGISVLLFRFDGFNGEMLPQVKWRFGSQQQGQWQATPVATPATSEDVQQTPASFALANSTQFLGSNRNGLVNERLFEVPSSDSEVDVLWDIPVGEGWSSFSVVRDRAVTLEQRDEMECVTCYRLGDGQLMWIDEHKARHQNPLGGIGPRSTATIVDGRIYAMGAMGFLRVMDLQTGDRIWTGDLLAEAGWTALQFSSAAPWGQSQSPLVIESLGLVVVGFGGPVDPSQVDDEGMTDTSKSLIAFDWKTGDVKWKTGRDQFSYASPMLLTLDGKQQIVSVNEKTISGHEPASGEVLWTFAWPGQTNGGANCASAIAVDASRFLVGKGYGGGSALVQVTQTTSDSGRQNAVDQATVDSASVDWRWSASDTWTSSRVLKTKFNHTCVDGDVGFAISNGTLQAADLKQADVLWNQSRRDRFGQGQLMLVDDVLVAQSEPGDVVFVAADPSGYKELGRLDALDSKTWNIPTIAGRHLIVRNDRQAICYLLPAKK